MTGSNGIDGEYNWGLDGVKWYCRWSILNCWRLLANIANFWSNNVVTKSDTGSLEFEPDDDDDDWGRDGGGVSGWSFVIDDWEGIVVKTADEGGDDDEEAVAGGGGADPFDDLLRLRGWY